MKKLLTTAIALAVGLTASAQITWNVKLGGGLAMCAGGNDEGDMKGKFVGKIGVGIEKPLSANFSIMPSLEIALKGTKWENEESYYNYYYDYYYSVKTEETLSPVYIQIPVLAAYRLNLSTDWNLTLKAGPYLAYGIIGRVNMKESSDTSTYSDHGDMFSDLDAKRFDAGVDVGVDFEYHRFVFGLEYERGFVSFAPSDADVKIYNQAAYVTVGYKF